MAPSSSNGNETPNLIPTPDPEGSSVGALSLGTQEFLALPKNPRISVSGRPSPWETPPSRRAPSSSLPLSPPSARTPTTSPPRLSGPPSTLTPPPPAPRSTTSSLSTTSRTTTTYSASTSSSPSFAPHLRLHRLQPPTRFLQSLAHRRPRQDLQEARRLHHRRSYRDPRPRRRRLDGRGQFLLRPQEASLEAARAGPDQGGHRAGPSGGHLASVIYRRGGYPYSSRHVPVLAPVAEPLIDVGFSRLGDRMTMSRTIRLYKPPESAAILGLRKMELRDLLAVTRLLREYLSRFAVASDFDETDVEHWLLPGEDVVDGYLMEKPETHEIADFFSFYTLPSSIISNQNYLVLTRSITWRQKRHGRSS